jgi:hypothetical protein
VTLTLPSPLSARTGVVGGVEDFRCDPVLNLRLVCDHVVVTDDTAVAADRFPANSADGIDHLSGALVAVLAGALLSVTADVGALALLVAVALTQTALVAAWVFGTALPGRIGAIVIGALAAGGSDTIVSLRPHSQLGALLPVLGLVLPAMFIHQLTRGVVRNRVVESLSDIALLIVAVVALAALLQLRHEQLGEKTAYAVALIAPAALVVGHLVDMVLPAPRFDPTVPRGLVGVLASAGVAGLVGKLTLGGQLEFAAGRSVFLGASIGVLVALFAVGAGFIEHATSLPATARAMRLRPVFSTLLPIAVVAPVAYLLCLAIHA